MTGFLAVPTGPRAVGAFTDNDHYSAGSTTISLPIDQPMLLEYPTAVGIFVTDFDLLLSTDTINISQAVASIQPRSGSDKLQYPLAAPTVAGLPTIISRSLRTGFWFAFADGAIGLTTVSSGTGIATFTFQWSGQVALPIG